MPKILRIKPILERFTLVGRKNLRSCFLGWW